jgi:hypothetical protein
MSFKVFKATPVVWQPGIREFLVESTGTWVLGPQLEGELNPSKGYTLDILWLDVNIRKLGESKVQWQTFLYAPDTRRKDGNRELR